MPIQIIPPVTINDTTLISSNVAETDYAAWSSGSTYALGDRVIVVGTTHMIYESLQAGNNNKNPTLAANSTWWIAVSSTNKWKMFDTSNSTATTNASSISVTITPGQAVTGVGLLNISGSSVRVRVTDPTAGTVYDTTTAITGYIASPDWFTYFLGTVAPLNNLVLLDLPSYAGCSVLIDITGSGTVSVGTCIMGIAVPIGATDIFYGASVGIQDYSGKTTNTFGDTVLTKRNYSKRANFTLWIGAVLVDSTQDILANYRATPVLWIGNTNYASTWIFGIYKTFDVTIAYPTYSVCQLEIEGLT